MELIIKLINYILLFIDDFVFFYLDTKFYVLFLVPIVSLACFVVYRIFKLIIRQVYF